MNAVLSVRDLRKYFTSRSGPFWKPKIRTVRAVDGVSFDLGENETLGLVGESGCGKSTTGSLLVRLLDPTSGSILYRGTELAGMPENELAPVRKKMQMIFQDPYASLDPMMTLGAVVAEPWDIHGLYGTTERRVESEKLLALVGLEGDYAKRYPHELSGGQRQRVAIARALALDPEILIADEPTSALDVSVKAQIINLLRDIRDKRGLSMIFVSHDLGVVRHVSDRIVVMYLGRVMEEGFSRDIFAKPRHPYTRALLDAIPVPDPSRIRQRKRIRGEASLKDALTDACPFLPRCPNRGAGCDSQRPPLVEVGPGHRSACLYPDAKEAL
jgi:oligopeptide/dipeptide ABC transporter ATP-binding protein